MSLTVELISRVEDLSEADLSLWNRLAPNPFLRWEWLGPWWSSYGVDNSLYVLRIKRDDQPIAYAPWFLEKRLGTGQTIQFLGSGKVCSDHMTLLVTDQECQSVCEAIARWLNDVVTQNESGVPKQHVWDSIELIGADQTDVPINALVQSLTEVGLSVDQSEGMGCYVIMVPDNWEDYVSQRSKSGRREIRQSINNIDNGKIKVRTVVDENELDQVWDQFVTLHQRRRHASGTTGCFDHPPFDTFLREAASELLKSGMLELVIATVDGQPVATQFALVDDNGWFYYQSGMEPEASDLRPGLSVFCNAIRSTIETGRKRFDMLRGDEPYKLRWRAQLDPAQEVRVCSPRTASQLRNQAYSAGVTFKNLVKSSIGRGEPSA